MVEKLRASTTFCCQMDVFKLWVTRLVSAGTNRSSRTRVVPIPRHKPTPSINRKRIQAETNSLQLVTSGDINYQFDTKKNVSNLDDYRIRNFPHLQNLPKQQNFPNNQNFPNQQNVDGNNRVKLKYFFFSLTQKLCRFSRHPERRIR